MYNATRHGHRKTVHNSGGNALHAQCPILGGGPEQGVPTFKTRWFRRRRYPTSQNGEKAAYRTGLFRRVATGIATLAVIPVLVNVLGAIIVALIMTYIARG